MSLFRTVSHPSKGIVGKVAKIVTRLIHQPFSFFKAFSPKRTQENCVAATVKGSSANAWIGKSMRKRRMKGARLGISKHKSTAQTARLKEQDIYKSKAMMQMQPRKAQTK